MRTFVQPGDSLGVAVPYAGGVTAGQGVLVGALLGIAAVDGAQNALIEIATKGVFDIARAPSLAISVGGVLVPDLVLFGPALGAATVPGRSAAPWIVARIPPWKHVVALEALVVLIGALTL